MHQKGLMAAQTEYLLEIEGNMVRVNEGESEPGVEECTVYKFPIRIHLNGKTRELEQTTLDTLGKETETFPEKWTGGIECEGTPDLDKVIIRDIEDDPEYPILMHEAIVEYEGKVYRLSNN